MFFLLIWSETRNESFIFPAKWRSSALNPGIIKRRVIRWSLLAYANAEGRAHAEFKDDRAILSPVVDAISFRRLHHPDEPASERTTMESRNFIFSLLLVCYALLCGSLKSRPTNSTACSRLNDSPKAAVNMRSSLERVGTRWNVRIRYERNGETGAKAQSSRENGKLLHVHIAWLLTLSSPLTKHAFYSL